MPETGAEGLRSGSRFVYRGTSLTKKRRLSLALSHPHGPADMDEAFKPSVAAGSSPSQPYPHPHSLSIKLTHTPILSIGFIGTKPGDSPPNLSELALFKA